MFNSLYLPYPRNDLLILIPLLISILMLPLELEIKCLIPVYDKISRAIANILPAQFLSFMRPTSTPKIEHEDNFFIELDFCSTQVPETIP